MNTARSGMLSINGISKLERSSKFNQYLQKGIYRVSQKSRKCPKTLRFFILKILPTVHRVLLILLREIKIKFSSLRLQSLKKEMTVFNF